MATFDKTVSYAMATLTGTLATNTTLGTATRHDFAPITVEIPETTRTIKSVVVRVHARGNNIAALNITGSRVGVKINAVAFDDVDFTHVQTNTGENEVYCILRNASAYFAVNDPLTAAFTFQVGVAFAMSVADVVTCVTASVDITYDYDDAAATHVKTVRIPVQSHHTRLVTSGVFVEVGTTGGLSDAPANQMPALTGGSGLLPESGVVIVQSHLVIHGQEAPSTGTDMTMTVRVDGSTSLVRSTREMALASSCRIHDIIDTTALSSTVAHAFEIQTSIAQGLENVGAVWVITYKFTPATTTTVLNSIFVPFEVARAGVIGVCGDATHPERLVSKFWIQEPGTITLKQSGLVIADGMHGNGLVRSIRAPGQAYRDYLHANIARESEAVLIRRCDHGSSSWAVARGFNELPLECYDGVSQLSGSPLTGYALVNYTSGVAAAGIGAHNRTTVYMQQSSSSATAYLIFTPTAPTIPETRYQISGVVGEQYTRHNANLLSQGAARLAGEDGGTGWYHEIGHFSQFIEVGYKFRYRHLTNWFRDATHEVTGYGADIEGTREWFMGNPNTVLASEHQCCLHVTHHGITTDVVGVAEIGGVPVPNGTAIEVWSDSFRDRVGTGTTTAGAFTIPVLDSSGNVFASMTANGAPGRSASAAPGAISHDIGVFSGATQFPFPGQSAVVVGLATRGYVHVGSVEAPDVNPHLTLTTTADSIRDRIIAVIESLVPVSLSELRFKAYRNEVEANFISEMTTNPEGSWRRFSVRDTGLDIPPEISNTDVEYRRAVFTITVAYPHDHRAGPQNALDRDDAMSQDQHAIETAVGLRGYANFIDPHPNAAWFEGGTTRVVDSAGDFLVIEQTMAFYRSMS